MDESEFEGSLVLEKIAEIGRVDEFFQAVDSDDFAQAKSLMRAADLDFDTIEIVLKKMSESED